MLIKHPIISEKTMRLVGENRYTFAVDPKATKIDIKRVVERVFGHKVLKVQTITVSGKTYRTGRRWIMRRKSDWKKAIVTLEPGKQIDLFEVTKAA